MLSGTCGTSKCSYASARTWAHNEAHHIGIRRSLRVWANQAWVLSPGIKALRETSEERNSFSARLLALEDAIHVAGGAAELIEEIRSIADETAYFAIETRIVDRGQSVPSGQRNDQIAMRGRRRTARDNEATIWALRESRDGTLNLVGIPHIDDTQLNAERGRHGLRAPNWPGPAAMAGQRSPDRLCEEAVKDIRRPQQWAASEAAQSSALNDSTWGLVQPGTRDALRAADASLKPCEDRCLKSSIEIARVDFTSGDANLADCIAKRFGQLLTPKEPRIPVQSHWPKAL
jgi:hypothetical protein